jgi:acetyl esterase/lipase
MTNSIRLPISIFIIWVLHGSLEATPAASFTPPIRYLDEIFSDVSVTKDIVFGEAVLPNGERLKLRLNLYEPSGDKEIRRPAIVWIHGGGFFQGDKSDAPMTALARNFAQRGYVTVSINYRLERKSLADPNVRRPILDAMYDARAAVRWLRRNAASYRIDENKIAIGGGSAGAFTSLHVAYDSGEGDSGNPGFSSAVSAVVAFWGGLLDAQVMKSGAPPLLVIHGTADQVVPFSMAERLVQRAKEVGVFCEFHPLEGKGHAAWGMMNDYIVWIAPFLYDNVVSGPRRSGRS